MATLSFASLLVVECSTALLPLVDIQKTHTDGNKSFDMSYEKSTDNDINIIDSYQVSKYAFRSILEEIKDRGFGKNVFANRRVESMILEWSLHNLLFCIGIAKKRTKDVDINWPQRWYVNALYNVLGCIAWLFIS